MKNRFLYFPHVGMLVGLEKAGKLAISKTLLHNNFEDRKVSGARLSDRKLHPRVGFDEATETSHQAQAFFVERDRVGSQFRQDSNDFSGI